MSHIKNNNISEKSMIDCYYWSANPDIVKRAFYDEVSDFLTRSFNNNCLNFYFIVVYL